MSIVVETNPRTNISKPKMQLVKNPTSFDLVIPEEVEAKIRHLCSKVHDVEWSGTLFYKVEGSLDAGNFKAICMDICVMDIGTAGYTEFKDTEDIIAYRFDHREDLLKEGIYEALIHSHNNMPAFFSSTDESTLRKEGSEINHFLSLIVCNGGEYVARITRKLKTKITAEAHIVYTKTQEYQTYEDEKVVLADKEVSEGTKTETKEDEILEYFEGNICKSVVKEPFKEIDERLDEIKRNKRVQQKEKPFNATNVPSNTKPYLLDQFGQARIPFRELEEEEPFGQEASRNNLGLGQEDMPDDEPVEFYMTEKVPTRIIKTLCTQLLCGSILATKADLNLNTWTKKMDRIYSERFGDVTTGTYESLRLENWIEQFIEHLIGYSVDEDYENEIAQKYGLGEDYEYEDSDAFIHLYAYDMIDFLERLPESVVKDMMIEQLVKLMPNDFIYDRNT